MLFVGLNNPGKEYQNTRHNIGEVVLSLMFPDLDVRYDKYINGRIASTQYCSQDVMILFPDTYMNHSGASVKAMIERYDIPVNHIIIFHDDIDLPFGKVKCSTSRGAGGQNGVRSIQETLKTKEYTRIRIGIAHPHFFSSEGNRKSMKEHVRSFVLGSLTQDEITTIKGFIPDIEKDLIKVFSEISMNNK